MASVGPLKEDLFVLFVLVIAVKTLSIAGQGMIFKLGYK
jgi:hypothetical protein